MKAPKWYHAAKPWPRCPVVMRTKVGPHQCEMNADYPHTHRPS